MDKSAGGNATSPRAPLNINEQEIELLKTVFTNNEALLQTIRAALLGLPLDENEIGLIKSTFDNKPMLAIFKRRFLPEFDKKSGIGQVQDLWMGVEKMVFGYTPDTVNQALNYKQQAIDLTRQGFERLTDPENADPVDLTYKPSKDNSLGIKLLGRNQYISHVEQQLLMIWMIVSQAAKAAAPVPTLPGGRLPTRGKGTK